MGVLIRRSRYTKLRYLMKGGTHPQHWQLLVGGWVGYQTSLSFYNIEASKMLIKIVDMTRTGRDGPGFRTDGHRRWDYCHCVRVCVCV
jgi:hypothetical protein